MNDKREDQLLCPQCYIPVSVLTIRHIDIYTCGTCEINYIRPALVSANELQTRIEGGIEEENDRRKV